MSDRRLFLFSILITIFLFSGCATRRYAVEERIEKHPAPQVPITSSYDTELQRAINLLSRGQCTESIALLDNLYMRYPDKPGVQYYLACAYDKCGRLREALEKYEDYVDMRPGNDILVHRAKNRIREIREELIHNVLGEADKLAEEHKYEYCLNRLEEAYELGRSTSIANNIIDKYLRNSMGLIARDMSSRSDSLREKTVSVIPFTTLNGGDSEDGKAFASILVEELNNINKLEVYERDDVSIKHVLKELEMAETGLIDEGTKKELGKLVNSEAVIVGWVDYFNTLKINARMIHVETGRIIVSKNVNIIGWSIADTNKTADFNISVWTDRKVYRIGDTATVYLRSNRDCYVTLLNVRSNGEIWELFPNRYNTDNFIRANVTYTIPSNDDNFRLKIVYPPGREYIKAIATSIRITPEQMRQVLSGQGHTSTMVASADTIMQGENPVFRSVSSSEMRGLHVILTRGIAAIPIDILPTDYPEFDYAVSTYLFETRR